MKKYSDVCAYLASRVFSHYMGGSMDMWGSVSDSITTTALIYGKRAVTVGTDVEKEFERVRDEHYKKVKA